MKDPEQAKAYASSNLSFANRLFMDRPLEEYTNH